MLVRLLSLVVVALPLGSLAGQTSVFDVVAASPDHTLLEEYLEQTGLDETLDAEGAALTLFAPTDAAFEALPPDTLAALVEDAARLRALLLYHVIGAGLPSSEIAVGQSFVPSLRTATYQDSALGLSIQILKDDGVTLNGTVSVETADLEADNGVVHSVGGVLQPLSLGDVIANSPAHATLAELVEEAEVGVVIDGQSFPVTLFAPTDEAFAALPDGTLDDLRDRGALGVTLVNHLFAQALPSFVLVDEADYAIPIRFGFGFASQLYQIDGQLGFKDIDYTPTDVVTRNGILHVVPEVATLPSAVDFVEFSYQHSALETLLDTADLVEAVDDLETLTLFAPTDNSILGLGNEALDALLADERQLRDLLLYHVLPQAADVGAFPQGLAFAPSAATYGLQFERFGAGEVVDSLLVDGLRVITRDLLTTDGVVHVPAGVLRPRTVAGIVQRSPVHATLTDALALAELTATLDDDGARYTVFAPTDAAFEALGGTLDELRDDPTGSLRQVLLYHVVGDSLLATELAQLDPAAVATLQGESIELGVDGTRNLLTVDDGAVIFGNVIGTNGVVHVADVVLTPEVITDVTEVLASAVGIAIGPNPAREFVNVTFEAALDEALDLTLYDASGGAVLRSRAQAGTTHLDLRGVAPGTYFLLMSGQSGAYYQPLLVQ